MWRLIIPIFLTFILLCLQWLPSKLANINLQEITDPNSFKSILKIIGYYLYYLRILIGLLCAAGISIFTVKESVWDSRKKYQAIIENQLKDIMADCFSNQSERIRITVFRKESWSVTLLHYIFHNYIKVIKITLHPKKEYLSTPRNIPETFFKYLIIFARVGGPGQSIHSTIFKIPDDNAKVDGVVGLAWKSRKAVQVSLPDINTINNLKKYKKLEDIPEEADRNNVKEYMRLGNISGFEKLKLFHRYSVTIWAKRIYDPGDEPWGVIVIDSTEKNIIDEPIEAKLDQYTDKIRKIIDRNYNVL